VQFTFTIVISKIQFTQTFFSFGNWSVQDRTFRQTFAIISTELLD